MLSVSQWQNECGRGAHWYFSWHSAEGKEQPKSGVATAGQVLKINLLIGPNASSDWPGAVRSFMGLVMRMATFIKLLAQPLTSPHFTVYRASSEMTFYQKKHDVKLFRPLILPLTQVSENIAPILSWINHYLLCVSHALDPKKAGGDIIHGFQ